MNVTNVTRPSVTLRVEYTVDAAGVTVVTR